MRFPSILAFAGSLTLFPLLAGCGDGTATLTVVATDTEQQIPQGLKPADVSDHKSIILHVEAIEVHVAEGADDDDEADDAESAWHDILEDGPVDIDLVALADGNQDLSTGEIPSGTIKEIRLVLAKDQGFAEDAEGNKIPVNVPSGSSSGLKIKTKDLVAEPGTELTVEFDLVGRLDKKGNLDLRPTYKVRGDAD